MSADGTGAAAVHPRAGFDLSSAAGGNDHAQISNLHRDPVRSAGDPPMTTYTVTTLADENDAGATDAVRRRGVGVGSFFLPSPRKRGEGKKERPCAHIPVTATAI